MPKRPDLSLLARLPMMDRDGITDLRGKVRVTVRLVDDHNRIVVGNRTHTLTISDVTVSEIVGAWDYILASTRGGAVPRSRKTRSAPKVDRRY